MGDDWLDRCSNACRATIDCTIGMLCKSTFVDEELNAFTDICVVNSVTGSNNDDADPLDSANEGNTDADGDDDTAGNDNSANDEGTSNNG